MTALSRAVGRPRRLWSLPSSSPGMRNAAFAVLSRVTPHGMQVAAVGAIAISLVAVSYGLNHAGYNIWGAFWVAPVLLMLSIPIAHRAARRDGQAIGRIVLLAAVLKVSVAPAIRYWMAYGLYGGVADATRYHEAGKALGSLFRHGDYGNLGEVSGTRFLEILTGQVYAFTGPTRLGGFMVFSWFSFLGLYLFYRAFRIVYPDGNGVRYAVLVFFFPSLFFWPSSIGKDAFMILVLGATALGAAQVISGRLRGLVWLALGLWGAVVVRPHIALIVGVGLVVAAPIAALGGGDRRSRRRSRMGSAALLLALLLGGSTLIGVAQNFFHLESLNVQTAQEQLDEVTRRSGEKGSTFTRFSPNDPVGFALSGFTVLFRPFPGEVRNVQGIVTGLEGVTLLVLCLLAVPRLVRLPIEILRRPYVAFALVYTFAFTYAFSSIVNFGILARQRSQLLPLVLVLLCIPRSERVPSVQPASDNGASA